MWYRTLGGIVTLTLGLLLAPLAAAAPPPARMARIGWLGVGIPAAPASRPSLPHFLEGLRALGYGGTQSHHGVPMGQGEARTPARLTAMLSRGLLPPCLIHCAEGAQPVPRARCRRRRRVRESLSMVGGLYALGQTVRARPQYSCPHGDALAADTDGFLPGPATIRGPLVRPPEGGKV
jgi:hypothetical protein